MASKPNKKTENVDSPSKNEGSVSTPAVNPTPDLAVKLPEKSKPKAVAEKPKAAAKKTKSDVLTERHVGNFDQFIIFKPDGTEFWDFAGGANGVKLGVGNDLEKNMKLAMRATMAVLAQVDAGKSFDEVIKSIG